MNSQTLGARKLRFAFDLEYFQGACVPQVDRLFVVLEATIARAFAHIQTPLTAPKSIDYRAIQPPPRPLIQSVESSVDTVAFDEPQSPLRHCLRKFALSMFVHQDRAGSQQDFLLQLVPNRSRILLGGTLIGRDN